MKSHRRSPRCSPRACCRAGFDLAVPCSMAAQDRRRGRRVRCASPRSAGSRSARREPGAGLHRLQVNGGGGVLFNDAPTVDTIRPHRRGASPLRHDGTAADADQRRRRRDARAIAAVDEAIDRRRARRSRHPSRRTVSRAARKGVHDPAQVPCARRGRRSTLVGSLRRGRTLLTLAPERVVTEALRDAASRAA